MKSCEKNNILKEAGILLIILVIVLSTTIVSGIGNFQGPPEKPSTPSGPTEGEVDVEYTFCTSTTDPEDDDVYYWFDWGDGTNTGWLGPYSSGMEVCVDHTYASSGIYCITVKAKDAGDAESSWSDELCIPITGECGTFMGLEVCPLGDAMLDIGEVLRVWNLDDEGDDGVWVNLEDTYNSWDCFWEDPNENDSLPIGASLEGRLYGVVDGEPDQFISKFSETKVDDNTWEVAVTGDEIKSYSVEAFMGNELVFRKVNITVENPSGNYIFGEVLLPTPWYRVFDGHGGSHCTDKIKNNNDLIWTEPYQDWWVVWTWKRLKSNEEGVLWNWEDHGVSDLEIDNLMIWGEYIDSTISIFSDLSIYAQDIPSITITEMYARYNEPPEKPNINGPTNGKAGEVYNYTFITTDPEGNDIYYYVAWGDDFNLNYIGPYSSGEEVRLSHEWSEDGTYIVQAIAKDIHFFRSECAAQEISIPETRTVYHPLLLRLFERFPILRYLLGL